MHRTAFAPAGVGNLAAGFDLLGHTLDGPRDRVMVRRIEAPEVRVAAIRGGVGGIDVIPFDPTRNTAARGVVALRDALCLSFGFAIWTPFLRNPFSDPASWRSSLRSLPGWHCCSPLWAPTG